MLRTWYISLDRLIGPSLTTRDALKKVFLDQVIFAPALFAVLLPLFGFSQGMNTEQVKDKVSKVNSLLPSCQYFSHYSNTYLIESNPWLNNVINCVLPYRNISTCCWDFTNCGQPPS